MATPSWLSVTQGRAPLLVSIPHTGIDLAALDRPPISTLLGPPHCDRFIY
ncbi:N-formylglutamate deformylase, partial [Mesorhizobium sp. M00.F.Ca.ET.149.01.1.1]